MGERKDFIFSTKTRKTMCTDRRKALELSSLSNVLKGVGLAT